jgi:hypothetical protein
MKKGFLALIGSGSRVVEPGIQDDELIALAGGNRGAVVERNWNLRLQREQRLSGE